MLEKPVYSINVKTILGEEQALSQYDGKVLLIVNVASQCGFTGQYSALQKLYERYENQGFCILAFPSNDFGRQEPGEDSEIKEFCETKFGVSFDLFSKTRILGPKQSPLYRSLQESDLVAVEKIGLIPFLMKLITGLILKFRSDAIPKPNDVKWNFHKFLIDRKGFPVARFSSEIEPDSPLLIKKLEEELQK